MQGGNKNLPSSVLKLKSQLHCLACVDVKHSLKEMFQFPIQYEYEMKPGHDYVYDVN